MGTLARHHTRAELQPRSAPAPIVGPGSPLCLDLPGSPRRIIVEPLRIPEPAPPPQEHPEREQERDAPQPEREPVQPGTSAQRRVAPPATVAGARQLLAGTSG